jgi:hypothetical protein
MSLILEDGTCVPTANAFVARADLIAYAADYYPGTSVPDDTTTDAAIMRASLWLSTYPEWDGSLACGRGNQGLAWPRSGVTDCNGDAVADDEVPFEVEQATYIAALAEIETPGLLTPTITTGKQTKREKVDVIEVEYMTPSDRSEEETVESLRPVLTAVGDLIKCLATVPSGTVVPHPWVA